MLLFIRVFQSNWVILKLNKAKMTFGIVTKNTLNRLISIIKPRQNENHQHYIVFS